jgi:hypothetical protein
MTEHTCEKCIKIDHMGETIVQRCDDCLEQWFLDRMK